MEEKTTSFNDINNIQENFDGLFRKYYKSLCYAAMQNLDNAEDAEDVVQELFTEIYSKKDTIKINSSFKNYIFGALYYKCIAFNKKRKNLLPNEVHYDEIDTSSLPIEIIENMELEALVFKTIDTLPAQCRKIFEMSRFDELKNKEIASKLNLSIKTVENQMSIALKRLYKAIHPLIKLLLISVLQGILKDL